MSTADRLPDFPWDTIAGAKAVASAHPDGIVDLSVGTPVDPTPQLGRDALAEASDAHGYPTVWGTSALRQAVIDYLVTRWAAITLPHEGIMPVIGTKELVAWLPTLLGLGPDDLVVYPTTAYPTYEVGAALARTQRLACDDPGSIVGTPRLIWLNSPANPHGAILDADATRAWITYAREVGAILASDECYGEFAWDAEPVSVLRADLCDGRPDNLLALGSLSKRSNLAGYRAGYVAGDPAVVMELVGVRKHAGMMVPTPVQEAMRVLLGDQGHVEAQRERYLARRRALRPALEAAGFRVDHSEGSLYLWVTRGEDCRATVDWMAERGILVAPGDFYGAAGRQHVRVALTATDERIAAAVTRLSAS
ncbi:MAG TPA: succinyldiaminopimelate transaminase [Propionibacteriaceae bacterium]|nr:succinyldiaminopimelate transaminase [Propionibacteriaceae bacterium]